MSTPEYEKALAALSNDPLARLRYMARKMFHIAPGSREDKRLDDSELISLGLNLVLDLRGAENAAQDDTNPEFDFSRFEELSRGENTRLPHELAAGASPDAADAEVTERMEALSGADTRPRRRKRAAEHSDANHKLDGLAAEIARELDTRINAPAAFNARGLAENLAPGPGISPEQNHNGGQLRFTNPDAQTLYGAKPRPGADDATGGFTRAYDLAPFREPHAAESAPERERSYTMSEVSEFFKRDSRRYDNAFERY